MLLVGVEAMASEAPLMVTIELQPAPLKGKGSPPHHYTLPQSSPLWDDPLKEQDLSASACKLLPSIISEPDAPTNDQLLSAGGKLQIIVLDSNFKE